MSIHTVTITFDLDANEETTRQFCDYIIITALEGGIGYWSQATTYRPDDGYAHITVSDDDIEVQHTIDRDTIAAGIARIAAAAAPFYDPNGARTQCAAVPFLSKYAHDTIVQAAWERDASNIDADLADTIVQVSLFDKIVYG